MLSLNKDLRRHSVNVACHINKSTFAHVAIQQHAVTQKKLLHIMMSPLLGHRQPSLTAITVRYQQHYVIVITWATEDMIATIYYFLIQIDTYLVLADHVLLKLTNRLNIRLHITHVYMQFGHQQITHLLYKVVMKCMFLYLKNLHAT